MRIGIIDLGTNSVRFDIHQINRRGQVGLLHREKLMIRLGEGVFLTHRLDPHAVRRTIQAFVSFHKTATLLHAKRMIAFGTSALREASDAEKLVEMVRKKTGIDIRIISGNEEARLIAQGILANEDLAKEQVGLVDIGGGSTEISICQNTGIRHSASFALGTARLQQVFLQQSPPRVKGTDPAQNLRKYAKTILLPTLLAEEWPKVDTVIGSSGTIRALEKILIKNFGTNRTDRRSLRKLIDFMRPLNTRQLLLIPGMEAKRVDMILAGAILLDECMDALGAKEFLTTTYSLRDGILEREVQVIVSETGNGAQFQIKHLYQKAKRLGCDETHFKQVMSLCEEIFDQTRKIHRLAPQWKRYLTAAAILHDVGEAISPIHHETHSYYVTRNADFQSMEKWEAEFIARLCLLHNGGKLSAEDYEFLKEKSRQNAFTRLLAILRVADALDRGHQGKTRIRRIRTDRNAVRITLSGNSMDLGILRLEQKKALFEQVFKRSIVVDKTS